MKSIITLSVLLLASAVNAAEITINLDSGSPVTITPTATQITAIQKLTDIGNTQRAAETPPLGPLSREEWIRDVLVTTVQGYVRQARSQVAREACVNYAAADAATKTAIDNALKGSPCP